jgi:glycosyltransferase involved in cell wall biosynthesis
MNSAGVQRPLQMSKLLPRFGVDVTVLTHSYSRSDLCTEAGILRVYDTNSTSMGKLLHYPMRVLQRIARALGRSTSWHGVWTRGVKRRADKIFRIAQPDVVMSTYPPLETLDLGLYFSEKFAVPLIADFRDGLLFEPIESRMLRSKSTRSRYLEVEQRVARQAAGIITVSDPITDYFRTEYQPRVATTIPNGFDPDEKWAEPSARELDPTKFNLVYTGRLGLSEKGRHAPAFIEAVTRVVKTVPQVADKLRIHFLGELSASEVQALSELIEMGVGRIHGLVDRSRALGFQRAATMVLLITASGKTSVATSKLFEYLNSGRPILGVTRNTAAERIIIKTQAGLVVDPDDADAIARMIEGLVVDPRVIGSVKRSEGEIEKYSRPNQMKVLASFLRDLTPATTAAGQA